MKHDLCCASNALGVWGGYSPNPTPIPSFETWLGQPVDMMVTNLDQSNRNTWRGSLGGQIANYNGFSKPVVWGIPLIFPGETLAQGASGAFDADWLFCLEVLYANRIAAGDPGPYHLRPNWEFNGDWEAWASAGVEQDYINCWIRFWHVAFTYMPGMFKFTWCPNEGGTLGAGPLHNPELSYPGNGYVDIIGMDVYYNTVYNAADGVQAFFNFKGDDYGLQWQKDFASARNKPIAFPEWGVNSNLPGASFVLLMAAWFANNNTAYQSYWESSAAFNGILEDNQYPYAAGAYISAFMKPQN